MMKRLLLTAALAMTLSVTGAMAQTPAPTTNTNATRADDHHDDRGFPWGLLGLLGLGGLAGLRRPPARVDTVRSTTR